MDDDDMNDYVVVVNPANGTSTKIVEVEMGIGGVGVAFDGAGTLFASDGTSNKLYTINLLNGTKTFVGDFKNGTGHTVRVVNNLQFDPDSDRFLAIGVASPKSLYGIDPITAVATKIAELSPQVENACSIARAPDTGEWFSVDKSILASSKLIKIDPDTAEVTIVGPLLGASSGNVCGLVFEEVIFMPPDDGPSGTTGHSGHEPPTIGKSLDGVRQVVDGGMAIDDQTWTVTQGYHQEFELLQMLTSPHTISNVIHCDKGVQYCNYIAVGFMALTDDFNNPVMTVSASKDHLGDWTIDWDDPNDYISDPDDV